MPEHVDVSGLVCPRPNMVVRRCLRALEPGETLVVEGDYPPAARSIRRSCYKHGYPVAEVDVAGDDGDAGTDDPERFALRIRVPDPDAEGVTPLDGEQ